MFWSCFTLIYCIILSVLEEFGDANEIWIKHLWSLQKSDSNVECYFKYLVQFFYFGFLQIFEQVLSELEPLCLAEQDFISKFFKLQQHQSMPGTVVCLLFVYCIECMICNIISLINMLSQFQYQDRRRKNL